MSALEGSITAKLGFIGLLIPTLLIPPGMIEGLVREASLSPARRATRSREPGAKRKPAAEGTGRFFVTLSAEDCSLLFGALGVLNVLARSCI